MDYRSLENIKRQWLKFADLIAPEPNSGCWLWMGGLTHHGYGRASLGKSNVCMLAHRMAWEATQGPIPDGMLICHKCDVPLCVNPDHLFVGTYTDNNRDMVAKGRSRAAKMTTCKFGHPLSQGRRQRICKECIKRFCRDYYRRKKRKALAVDNPDKLGAMHNGVFKSFDHLLRWEAEEVA